MFPDEDITNNKIINVINENDPLSLINWNNIHIVRLYILKIIYGII